MGGLTKERKAAILAEEEYCCHYCSDTASSIDHVIPVSLGGTGVRSNLVAACIPCNQAKASLPYDLYLRYVQIFGRPHGHRWYRATNAFVDKAMTNIAGRVGLPKMVEIVLDQFTDGDTGHAKRLIRRCHYRLGGTVDDDILQSLLDLHVSSDPVIDRPCP